MSMPLGTALFNLQIPTARRTNSIINLHPKNFYLQDQLRLLHYYSQSEEASRKMKLQFLFLLATMAALSLQNPILTDSTTSLPSPNDFPINAPTSLSPTLKLQGLASDNTTIDPDVQKAAGAVVGLAGLAIIGVMVLMLCAFLVLLVYCYRKSRNRRVKQAAEGGASVGGQGHGGNGQGYAGSSQAYNGNGKVDEGKEGEYEGNSYEGDGRQPDYDDGRAPPYNAGGRGYN